MEQALSQVRTRISAAAERSGRDASSVSLVAVSKTHPPEVIRNAVRLGVRVFGENRVQEAQRKIAELNMDELDIEFRLIGHLQSNKAKLVPPLFRWVESIDSLKIARAVAQRFSDVGRTCEVLLQLNSSGEESKSGFARAKELIDAAKEIGELGSLHLRGVMTIGPFVEDADQIRSAFARTRECFLDLQQQSGSPGIDTLSMGMTDDFEIAIEEGSTEVRIGSALFGGRGTYA